MDCKEFKEKIFLYPEVEEDFYNHLKECSHCRKKFELFQKMEKKLREPFFKEEIELEWAKISKETERKLTLEKYKRIILIGILSLLGSLLSLSIFLFLYYLYYYLNLPLILWGVRIILREFYNSLTPLIIGFTIFVTIKKELHMKNFKNGNN